MGIRQTAIGCDFDPTKDSRLACHVLELCQSRVLLECPLDLSALTLFLPAFLTSKSLNQPNSCSTVNGQNVTRRSKISSGNFKPPVRTGNKREQQCDVLDDLLLVPSTSTKRFCVDHGQYGAEESGKNDTNGYTIYEGLGSPFKELNGQVFVDGEPWYKTADLEHVDVGLLDAVIISNPSGMLGLPFLTKHPDFCGKVYATKATAEIGKMMMEEVVSMHAAFIQSHGRPNVGQRPSWLNQSALGTLPAGLRSTFLSRCLSSRANWQSLYSATDVRDCMLHVQKLRYGEVVSVDGSLTISPSSSGLGIGTSNWSISGVGQSVGYIAASLMMKNPALPLDLASLKGTHTLLISDVECPSKPLRVLQKSSISDKVALDIKGNGILETDPGAQGVEQGGPARQSSTGSGSSQRLTPITSLSFSSGAGRVGPSSGSVGAGSSGPPGQPAVVPSEKGGKGGSGELGGLVGGDMVSIDVRSEVATTCTAAIEAIRKGGSVLIPTSPDGVMLELLDELAVKLLATNMTHVPVYCISPAAEEILAYGNTVPEWLSSARQDKLYAGESLFGYVDLVQEERLSHFDCLTSSDLQRVWQEPCIVFASHWSLRMGPSVHLLQRWRKNPLCLLILIEGLFNMELLLAPYMPLAIQVLEVPIASRLRPMEVNSLIQRLQPQLVMVPDSLQSMLERAQNTHVTSTQFYKKGQTIQASNLETELEVNMSAELAFQIQPSLMKPKKVATASFRADLCLRDGKLSIQTPSPSSLPDDVLVEMRNYKYRWGQVNVDAFLMALQDRGVSDVFLQETASGDSTPNKGFDEESHSSLSKSFMVEIRSPSQAWIKIGPNSSHIKANEPSLRHLVTDAFNSVLQVM